MRTNFVIAKVAVLVNTGQRCRVFDYLIPSDFTDLLRIGAKVTVPFGNRPIHGYVFDLSNSSEYPDLKEILDLEPEELWLTSSQIGLARWMSEYYLAPLATVLETLVPGGFQGKYRLYYTPATQVVSDFNLAELRPGASSLLNYLSTKAKPVSRQELMEVFGPSVITIISELVTAGLVCKIHQLSADTMRVKSVKGYELAEGSVQGVTALQNKVVEYLRRDGPASYKEVFQATGVSRAVVTGLVKKGLVQECTLTQNRRPLEILQQPVRKEIMLTKAQQEVYARIIDKLGHGFSAHLIHGITGSGKTEIYKRLAAKFLESGFSVLVLVPEIALTPRIAAEFTAAFQGQVAVLHSRLSLGERFDEWNRIRTGQAKVILGARSALFAPIHNLGLIVVDEEHENSYKQSEAPFYNGPKVAEALARQSDATLVLGSATPSVTTFSRAVTGELDLHHLPSRIGGSQLPKVEICDMRVELKAGNRSIFSRSLTNHIKGALAENNQVILFLNRRGYASFILCRSCGHVIRCRNCQVSLTVHRAFPRLSCHYCQHQEPLPKSCPVCSSSYIREFGVGTERVEREIRKQFPAARVARLDGETTSRKGSIQQILSSFANAQTDILVGTQMVAKGLDFPRVTVVGVIAADLALNIPDFASSERTFQLISQVAGRAGRGTHLGNVVVQTYNPEHYSIQAAATHDYQGFYQKERTYRELLNYPPSCDMVLVSISSPQDDASLKAGEALERKLRAELSESAKVLPIHPAPLPKLRNRYRHQIIIKWNAGEFGLQDREIVYKCCTNLPNSSAADVRVSIDVDPVSFL